MRKRTIVFLLFVLVAFYSCNTDKVEDTNDISILGDWLISEIIYNNNPLTFDECSALEHINFEDSYVFTW